MTEIGQTLRETRMRARIDITEVESSTKIRAKYLRAIENEEWDLLPGPVYIRSFLKTYGDYLGLDSRVLVDEFKLRYERPLEHERPLAVKVRERSQRSGAGDAGRGTGRASAAGGRPPRGFPIRGQWLAVGIVIVAIGAALWLLGQGGPNRGRASDTQVTPAGHTRTAHHVQTPTTAVRQLSKHRRHRPVAKPASLALVPTASVWVCIETPADKILVGGATYSVGETIPAVTGKELLVTLGNSDVTATVNGRPYTIPQSASATAFKVTDKGVTTLTSGPTCS